MDKKQSSKRLIYTSLAFLLAASSGIVTHIGAAEAKPPNHAPARGYRCRNGEAVGGGNNANCNNNNSRNQGNNQRNRNRDRDNGNSSTITGGTLFAGTPLEVEYPGSREIAIGRNQRIRLNVRVLQDIRDSENRIIIPRGSVLEGEFRPVSNGTQFFANRLRLTNGQSYGLNATSGIISTDGNSTAGNAAQILIGSILGNGQVLRGNSDVIVLRPGTRIVLTLQSDLRV